MAREQNADQDWVETGASKSEIKMKPLAAVRVHD